MAERPVDVVARIPLTIIAPLGEVKDVLVGVLATDLDRLEARAVANAAVPLAKRSPVDDERCACGHLNATCLRPERRSE